MRRAKTENIWILSESTVNTYVKEMQRCVWAVFLLLHTYQSVISGLQKENLNMWDLKKQHILQWSSLRFPLYFIKSMVALMHYESGALPQKSSYFPFQICSGYLNYLCADRLSESTSQINYRRVLLVTFNKQKHISVGCSFMTYRNLKGAVSE